ncbi:MAG: RND transporter, partial [Chitinophagales bacterium]
MAVPNGSNEKPALFRFFAIMWQSLGQFILKYRLFLLLILLSLTSFMAYHASKVELSYEFARAIPTDHPKYKAYQEFRKKFGEDGNLLVIGIQTNQLFRKKIFNSYIRLQKELKKINGVEDIISIPAAINLVKDSVSEKLKAIPIFRDTVLSQAEIDHSKDVFLNLPFYKTILYNPETQAWLMGVRINKNI